MERLEDWLSTTQAAALLDISEARLRALAKDRPDIQRRQVGKSVIWNKADVEKLAQERKKGG